MQAECDGSIRAVTFSLIDFPETTLLHFCPPSGGFFLSDSATLNRYLSERNYYMKIKNTLFVILMLSLPAISAEHSEMKMSDMHSSASSQEYMAGMKNMHEKK